MTAPAQGVTPPEADATALLPTGLDALAAYLLLYKALFRAPEYTALAGYQEDPAVAAELRAVRDETDAQVVGLLEAFADWTSVPSDVRGVADRLLVQVLADLLVLKEHTSEAVLLVGMQAPTDPLRQRFVKLADVDRRHADALRALTEDHRVRQHAADEQPSRRAVVVGAHDRRAEGATFAGSVEQAIEALVEDGHEPTVLVLSAVALRHARDEGALPAGDGTMAGLPVVVDFGWRGECFSVETRERSSYADILRGQASPA